MTDIKRLGLGCMGMSMDNIDRSVETVRYALDHGVSLFNTGEFYNGGESEMVLREAFKGVPRDSFFLSVKFGMLPIPIRGMYGIDVKPWNVKGHLAYSLHRLGLDYVDLYEPARIDEAIPVEEIVGAVQECVDAGYVRNIGLTELTADKLDRAASKYKIHTAELSYGIYNRKIETNGALETARKHGIGVLAFAVLNHGLLSDNVSNPAFRRFMPEEAKEKLVAGVREIAADKNTTMEKLLQAYVWCKNPDMSILIGTTRKEHLQESIDALEIELTPEDIENMEKAFPSEMIQGMGMQELTFRDGKCENENWRR